PFGRRGGALGHGSRGCRSRGLLGGGFRLHPGRGRFRLGHWRVWGVPPPALFAGGPGAWAAGVCPLACPPRAPRTRGGTPPTPPPRPSLRQHLPPHPLGPKEPLTAHGNRPAVGPFL